MNKVRIYDLSKELNLDNKDILEICVQLNIGAKSHSSTITEAEAAQIRAMAVENQSSSVSNNLGSSEEKNREKPKQEILAIHHKTTHSNSSETGKVATKPAQAQVLLAPPTKPLAVSKSRDEAKSGAIAPESKPELKTPSKPQLSELKREPPADSRKKEPYSVPKEPQLIEPPSRPKPPEKVESKILRTKPTKKTEIKREKIQVKSPSQTQETPKKEAKKPKIQIIKRPEPPQALKQPPVEEEETALASQANIEEEGTLELEVVEKPRKLKTKPKRLSEVHGQKAWEKEEEDEGKKQAKTKAGKNKRRQLIVDDEDDLEAELESVSVSTAINLSIARPPKPKSSPAQPVAATHKNKKVTVKSESIPPSRSERRRDKQVIRQRPESIVLKENLTVRELAEILAIPETEIIKQLFFKGIAVNITQTLDLDTARMVAEEVGVKVETPVPESEAVKGTEMLDAADLENLQHRPPVVTIMGHVDHGKTTLLDSIRKTKVAQGEAGGITQHIGAYHVDVEHDDKTQQIVFLDTPGHEAFTAMRARGARVTDIAILVVAADDGVQPQTKEAISHARAAEVPIVVAINKIDKPGCEPDRVKQELAELGLMPEEWGGDTIMVPLSALKGENLDTLLEMLLLVSELEELSANPDRPAKGTVIEAHLDRARGAVASLLVQNGTLRVGDVILAGSVFGKIRAMVDDRGNKVEAATPSFAVEILGLNNVPAAGDEFDVYAEEKEARTLAEARAEVKRETRLKRPVSLGTISAQAQEGELKELNLILKADVQGSVEAILGALQQLPQNEVQIRVLLSAAGEVTETDVDLAAASGAVIVGFNTTLATGARAAADREGVDIREYNIIYKLLDDIQGAMEGLLEPEAVEEPLGQAEVRAVFAVGRGAVAGCYVQSGKIVRNRMLRVHRQGQVVYQGSLDSLKRIKEDVREVNAGYECGIGCDKFNNWQEGDTIEAYQMVMKRRTLSAN